MPSVAVDRCWSGSVPDRSSRKDGGLFQRLSLNGKTAMRWPDRREVK